MGRSAMRARTSASRACGSTSLSLAVVISVYMKAVLSPPRSEPQNSHALRPRATPRSARSAALFVRQTRPSSRNRVLDLEALRADVGKFRLRTFLSYDDGDEGPPVDPQTEGGRRRDRGATRQRRALPRPATAVVRRRFQFMATPISGRPSSAGSANKLGLDSNKIL